MIDIKDERVYNTHYLIINEEDIISPLKFRGNRYDIIFIHKDRKDIEELKELLKPNISIMGKQFGNIYTYG